MNPAPKSYIDTQFEEGFMVSDEAIVKLHDIVQRRLKERNVDASPKWKVLRADSLVYETESTSEVVNEENSKRNLITRLELSVDCEFVKLQLAFDKKEKSATLRIEAREKDFSLLLNSDLKEYLQTEVFIFRSHLIPKLTQDRLLPGLLMPLGMLGGLAWSVYRNPKQPEINSILESSELAPKLNFLIQESIRRAEIPALKWMFLMVIGLVLLMAIIPAMNKLYPRNIFCFGKEATRYKGLCDIRSRWLWGGGISFIVSCIAGVAVWYFTK